MRAVPEELYNNCGRFATDFRQAPLRDLNKGVQLETGPFARGLPSVKEAVKNPEALCQKTGK